LFPLVDAFDAVDCEYSEMVDSFLEEFVEFGHWQFFFVPLVYDLIDFF